MAHNYTRNPKWGKTEDHHPTSSAVVNNIIYNWGKGGTRVSPGDPGGIKDISVVGNVYMDGVDTRILPIEVEPPQGDITVFLDDNMHNGVIPNDPWDIVTGGGEAATRVNAQTVACRPPGRRGRTWRPRPPQNVACGFPALRSSEFDSQHSNDTLYV